MERGRNDPLGIRFPAGTLGGVAGAHGGVAGAGAVQTRYRYMHLDDYGRHYSAKGQAWDTTQVPADGEETVRAPDNTGTPQINKQTPECEGCVKYAELVSTLEATNQKFMKSNEELMQTSNFFSRQLEQDKKVPADVKEPMETDKAPDNTGTPQTNKQTPECEDCVKYAELVSTLEATNQKLMESNQELMHRSNELEQVKKDKEELKQSVQHLQLQLEGSNKIAEQRNTKDAEEIESLRSQLAHTKKQLQDLIQQQTKRTSSVETTSSASYTSYQNAVPGLCGLANLGHSCYMNAALQCLNCIVPFRDHFLGDGNGQDKATGVVGAYKELVTLMWRGDRQPLRPEWLASEMAKISDLFDGKSPQDAQEFLSTLLENLNDTTKTEREPSIITKLFQGKLQSNMMCNGCGKTTTREDPFMFLPISIPDEQKYSSPKWTIQSGLEALSSEETFEENQWCCPQCHNMPKCTRRTEVAEAPELLIVHLKRFKITKHGLKQKVETSVDFPLNGLELTSTNTNLNMYKLFAVINHSGSIYGGCYSAYAKHGDKWYRFFDSSVSSLNERDVITSNAYVLFYERVKCQAVIRQPGLCGIPNFGNTCYISAAVQCLFSLAKVRECFETWNGNIEGSTENVQTVKALISLLKKILAGGGTSGCFKDEITWLYSKFEYKAQEDSHKFILSLLDAVKQCEGDREKKGRQSLTGIFQGAFRSHIQCSKCAKLHGQQKEESFVDLSVPVPDDKQEGGVTLDRCIQMACDEETNNYLYCTEQCRTYCPSKKVLRILRNPKILMVHLKRFRFNWNGKKKINTVISFPKTIDFTSYLASPTEDQPSYGLCAVLNHYDGNHYTAYCKHAERWYHYDDSEVKPISGYEEVVTPVAYILFYEHIGTII